MIEGEAAIASGISESLHVLMIDEQRCRENDALGWARERRQSRLCLSFTIMGAAMTAVVSGEL